MELRNVAIGWGKSLGLLEVSDQERAMSQERMRICADCTAAQESSILKLIRGRVEKMGAILCTACKCPVNEKSLVKDETCPLGKW